MATKTVSVNLTPFFVAWSALFVVLALVTGSGALWWVAAMPWLFFGVFILIGPAVIFVAYMRGYPVTLTTPRKGARVVRRGQEPVWKVRR